MHPRRKARPGLAAALILSLSACAGGAPGDGLRRAAAGADGFMASLFAEPGPEIRAMAGSPPPAAKPALPLTRVVAARDPRDGSPVRLAPRALGGGRVEVRREDGCVWRRDDWFAPSTHWRGCGDSATWRDGSATVVGGEGLWPLRIGAEGRFRRRATSSTGRSYARETVCRVTDAVEVLRAGGAATPAFVVDCADGKRVRTTWWAPQEGPIAFRKRRNGEGVEELWVAE